MFPTPNRILEFQVRASTVELIPKQSFIDWILSLDEHADQTESALQPYDTNLYLLPYSQTNSELRGILASHAEFLFASECMDWAMNSDDWPIFDVNSFPDKWFSVKIHSTTSDLRGMAQQGDATDAAMRRR